MASLTLLIPRRFGDVRDALRREARLRGVESELKRANLRIESVSGDPAVLINWVVHYVNTSGRSDYANYVSKSGKSIVLRSGRSLKVFDFRASDYSNFELGEGAEVSLRGEVSRREAKEYIVDALSESLRVPKKAVKIISAHEVILAKKVIYSFERGECSGRIELSERSLTVTFKPLPLKKLERKALESIMRHSATVAEVEVKRDKRVTISRSWDFLFDGKSEQKGPERMKEEVSSPEFLSRELTENHANFIIRSGKELRFIQVNRYSGVITANIRVADPEELKAKILRSFTELTSAAPSEADIVIGGISDLYKVEMGGKGPIVTSEVKVKVFPYVYSLKYDHSSGELSIVGREVDEGGLRAFLMDALGTKELSYEYEKQTLYVKAKLRTGWSFMVFDMSKLKRSPDLIFTVEKVFKDPRSDSYIIFCRAEESPSCLAFIVKHDLREGSVVKAPCTEKIVDKVRGAILSKYGASVRMELKHELDPDVLMSRIGPRVLFTTSRVRGDVSLHLSGVDATHLFHFNARYLIKDGSVIIDELRILDETPKRIVERTLRLRDPRILGYKYEHPFLQVRVKSEKGVIVLKYDLSNISNPSLIEKSIRKGILGMLKGARFRR